MSIGKTESVLVVENLTRQRILAERVKVALDSTTRRRGLLDIKDLDAESGLWISPCEAIHTFGMQIVLDVVFLDGSFRVRKIAADLKPNRIAFCITAQSVLELRSGRAAVSGLERGDQLLLRKIDQATVFPDAGRCNP